MVIIFKIMIKYILCFKTYNCVYIYCFIIQIKAGNKIEINYNNKLILRKVKVNNL